jgi:hypothetical protein
MVFTWALLLTDGLGFFLWALKLYSRNEGQRRPSSPSILATLQVHGHTHDHFIYLFVLKRELVFEQKVCALKWNIFTDW